MADFNVGNFGSAFSGGLQTGNALAQMRLNQEEAARAAQAREFLSQNAGALMSGDANALAGYAQFDPQGAFTMQRQMGADARAAESHSMDMQYTRQQLDNARQQGKINMEAHTAKMDALKAAKVAEGLTLGLQGAAMAYRQGPEAYAQYVQSNAQELQALGLTPEQLSYENFLPTAATVKGGIEALSNVGAAAQALSGQSAMTTGMQTLAQRAQAAGLQPGSPEYQQFMLQGGKNDGLAIEATPDGGVRVVQGAAAGNVKFTEGQSKDNVYSTRARGALAALEPVANTLANRGERIAEAVPFGLARGAQSDDFQVALNAGTELLQAILRKDTGAAITAQEEEAYGRVYLPQPGDGPAVLEQKRIARIRAIAAIEAGMSPAQILAQGKALLSADQEAVGGQIQTGENPFAGISEDQFRQIDIQSLSPEQIDQLFEARQR